MACGSSWPTRRCRATGARRWRRTCAPPSRRPRAARDGRRQLGHALPRAQEGAAAGGARGARARPRGREHGLRVPCQRRRRRAAPAAGLCRGRRAAGARRRLSARAAAPRALQEGRARHRHAPRPSRLRADALGAVAALQLRRRRRVSRRPLTRDEARAIFATTDTSLLEVIDNLLTKGVVLSGDVVLGIAGVDLVYARLSVLLCAVDKLLEAQNETGERP